MAKDLWGHYMKFSSKAAQQMSIDAIIFPFNEIFLNVLISREFMRALIILESLSRAYLYFSSSSAPLHLSLFLMTIFHLSSDQS